MVARKENPPYTNLFDSERVLIDLILETVRIATVCVVVYVYPYGVVNPGDTGMSIFTISARFVPFDPGGLFIQALPSALPSPKKYTYFVTTQVPKTTIMRLRYAGTTGDMGATVTKPEI